MLSRSSRDLLGIITNDFLWQNSEIHFRSGPGGTAQVDDPHAASEVLQKMISWKNNFVCRKAAVIAVLSQCNDQ